MIAYAIVRTLLLTSQCRHHQQRQSSVTRHRQRQIVGGRPRHPRRRVGIAATSPGENDSRTKRTSQSRRSSRRISLCSQPASSPPSDARANKLSLKHKI